jgi:3',5'-nucleoside bisphosphate phosphatase
VIDLHTHSTFSDGSLTPEELVALARRRGLSALALTDHDSTAGMPRFRAACAASAAEGYREGQGLRGIAGVEISVDVAHGTLHLLGYCLDTGHAGLEQMLERIRAGRQDRNGQILKRLNDLGLTLAWEDVASLAGEEVVGRPHFAQAMLAKGYVATKEEAFDRYLGKGKAAYFDRFRLAAPQALEVLLRAGGVPSLAHPFTLDLDRAALRRYVGELRDVGLQAIEVYYSEHSPDLTAQYLALAREFGLAVTGGSDFHGEMNPKIDVGVGFGALRVPDELADALLARARHVGQG